jgi:hypothetical protein
VTRQKTYRVELQRGLLAGFCALAACIPDAGYQAPSKGFCVKPAATCTPDPGPQPLSCAAVQAAEAGLEFFPYPIADFEQTSTATVIDVNQNVVPQDVVGGYVYSYTDATAQVYANRDGIQAAVGWEPIATIANLCDPNMPDQPNHVLHMSGGPYLGWGGGIGVPMSYVNQIEKACPPDEIAHPRDYCPTVGEENANLGTTYAILGTTLNMSQWDGVAVWARRAPDSQPLLRVLVGNKYVDEDVNYEQQRNGVPPSMRYCERSRECGCTNGRPCNKWEKGNGGDGEYYCWDPALELQPQTTSGSAIQATNKCYTSRCDDVYPAYPGDGKDPQFYGRPCTPYGFRSGAQGSYCWDPDSNNHYSISDGTRNPTINNVVDGPPDPNAIPDSPPAESDQGCGDYWTFPLHLTTEWRLYLVPFTEMLQQGWAKRWQFFDTSSVSVVRLTWDAGWIDYWIDNLRFYRVRRNGAPDAAASASQ